MQDKEELNIFQEDQNGRFSDIISDPAVPERQQNQEHAPEQRKKTDPHVTLVVLALFLLTAAIVITVVFSRPAKKIEYVQCSSDDYSGELGDLPANFGDKQSSVSIDQIITRASEEDKEDYLSTPDAIEKVLPSVVMITAEFESLGAANIGSGIIISSDGYIITNCHIIKDSYESYSGDNLDDYFFGYFGGFGGRYRTATQTVCANEIIVNTNNNGELRAQLIGYDENSDLALLKVNAKDLIPAVLGDSDSLRLGETAVAVGYPLNLGLSVSKGIISGLDKEMTVELYSGKAITMNLIQTDVSINSGNSGGPLINSRGEVIGIASSRLIGTEVENVGFAIPITSAISIADDILNSDETVGSGSPKIGITGTTISQAIQRYYNIPVDSGVMVVSVEADSCADNAGIVEGDIIIAADGKSVPDMNTLITIKNTHKPGETMTITLARSEENVNIELVLDGNFDFHTAPKST